LLVFLLAPPVLTSNNFSGRNMEDLYGGIGRVNPLPTRTSSPAHFNANVFRADLNIDFLGFWQDSDRRGRGMNPSLGFSQRNPLHPVYSALVTKRSEDRFAGNLEDDFLEPAQLRRAAFELFNLESVRLGKPRVHPVQIGSKQSGLVTTGTSSNLY